MSEPIPLRRRVKMANFEEAQRLFSAYQRNGVVHNLRDTLDILEEIIEHRSVDSQRATNFKNRISKHIAEQIKGIFVKCNIPDFAKDLKNIDDQDLLLKKLASVLSAALSKEDGKYLGELLTIQSEYFREETA
jgi:hypothetical protein